MMNKLLRNLNEDVLSACVHYTSLEYPAVLVLDDLTSAGYKLANRNVGLDLAHSELAIKSIAKYHATSLVYLENVRDNADSVFILFLFFFSLTQLHNFSCAKHAVMMK